MVGKFKLIFRKEMGHLMIVLLANVLNTTMGFILSKGTFCLFLLIYVWMGHTTNTELVYYLLNLFDQLSLIFGYYLPTTLGKVAQTLTSLERIDNLLTADDMPKNENEFTNKPSIEMHGCGFQFVNKYILKDISLNIARKGLTVVTGQVGAGKSILLRVMLGDFPVSEGTIFEITNLSSESYTLSSSTSWNLSQ